MRICNCAVNSQYNNIVDHYSLLLEAWEVTTGASTLSGALAALSRMLTPLVPFDSTAIIQFDDPNSARPKGDDCFAIHLTGVEPVEGESIAQLIERNRSRRPEPLGETRPPIPYEIVEYNSLPEQRVWHCNDLLAKTGWYEHEFILASGGIRAYVSALLIARGRVIGTAVFSRIKAEPFTPEQLKILGAMTGPLSVAAANAFANEEIRRLREKLQAENILLREQLGQSPWFDDLVGVTNTWRRVLDRVEQVASSEATVLITGETGTGKELIARALHRRSARAQGPLIRINCGAIPETLLASELFGHERGAFTGAHARRQGKFEQAHGGTLFLDEIGELSIELQVMLLRVLQEREFERLGGSHTLRVDVRLVAATNRDLASEIRAGRFRDDLFYRLNVFPLHVPPLRDRPGDIPPLVAHFAEKHSKRHGRTITRIDKEALAKWMTNPWPGNVRELENVVERAVLLSYDSVLRAEPEAEEVPRSYEQAPLADRALIENALKETGGRISGPRGAAQILGVKASTLEFRIRRLGINKFQFREISRVSASGLR